MAGIAIGGTMSSACVSVRLSAEERSGSAVLQKSLGVCQGALRSPWRPRWVGGVTWMMRVQHRGGYVRRVSQLPFVEYSKSPSQ
eukprot:3305926-Pyramimonas_sp.AAC.1